jgi:malate synthase
MTDRVEKHGLQIAQELYDFIVNQALPGTDVAEDSFWAGLSALAHDFGPENRALLEKREEIQQKLDGWQLANKGKAHDAEAYKAFLTEIG